MLSVATQIKSSLFVVVACVLEQLNIEHSVHVDFVARIRVVVDAVLGRGYQIDALIRVCDEDSRLHVEWNFELVDLLDSNFLEVDFENAVFTGHEQDI